MMISMKNLKIKKDDYEQWLHISFNQRFGCDK